MKFCQRSNYEYLAINIFVIRYSVDNSSIWHTDVTTYWWYYYCLYTLTNGQLILFHYRNHIIMFTCSRPPLYCNFQISINLVTIYYQSMAKHTENIKNYVGKSIKREFLLRSIFLKLKIISYENQSWTITINQEQLWIRDRQIFIEAEGWGPATITTFSNITHRDG